MIRKKALVTGAARGIGRAIALGLAEAGYDVGINDRGNLEEAEAVRSRIEQLGGRAIVIQADISRMADIDRMFNVFVQEFGVIDLLVNNAGITKFKPFLEVSEELWEELTAVDWKGSYFCAQRAARKMVERGQGGVIINITSVHQQIHFPHASVYGPSKAALEKFTKHAALELAPHGIRVNAIAPGSIKSEGGDSFTPRQRMFIARTPLQRMGLAEEIAAAVVFLSSDKASYMTGTTLAVEGGAMLPALLDNTYIADREEWQS